MAMAPVVVEATAKHTATLIFMHGLGDTGHGWSSAMAMIRPTCMKVICPTAPTQPVTLNAGFRMPSWFDLRTLDIGGPEDEEGIKAASQNVHAMINEEIQKGIPAERIVLGGFSQGGALALYSALTFNKRLAGVVALSCWLPLHKQFPASKANSDDIPIFQAHGDFDPVVPYKFGQLSASYLKSFMKDVTFKTYNGLSHSSSDQELDDVKAALAKWTDECSVRSSSINNFSTTTSTIPNVSTTTNNTTITTTNHQTHPTTTELEGSNSGSRTNLSRKQAQCCQLS